MFFSILEAIEVQFSSIFEMGNGHILNSATVLSSIIGMGDCCTLSTTEGVGKKRSGMDGWVKTIERDRRKVR